MIYKDYKILCCFSLLVFGINYGQNKSNEFDFWIGEWNVYKHNTDSIVGKSNIESIVDGKAIKETYHSTKYPYHGTSLNKYNQNTNQWEQYWVDNSGLTLHLKGIYNNDKMILQNRVISKKDTTLNKIEWQYNKDKSVRQTWYQSKDEGKNWKVVFDGDYKPRKQEN